VLKKIASKFSCVLTQVDVSVDENFSCFVVYAANITTWLVNHKLSKRCRFIAVGYQRLTAKLALVMVESIFTKLSNVLRLQ